MLHRTGTSPRLWGDFPPRLAQPIQQRYIPTPVGRLLPFLTTSIEMTVHPHACGEIQSASIGPRWDSGTSPRLWGDSRQNFIKPQMKRYIPTPVGRFQSTTSYAPPLTVHPHACGEIVFHAQNKRPVSGTSPRLWGDLTTQRCCQSRVRYIPTPVGRFDLHSPALKRRSVHPHACGEIYHV